MAAYHLGQSVKLSAAFTDANGAPSNPTTVTCTVEAPDGTETIYNAGSTPAVINPAVGSFEVVISPSQSGMWSWRWAGVTGPTTPVDEGRFHILGSSF